AQFGDRAERIGGAVHEEGGEAEARKMLGAQPIGPSGWGQRGGTQEERLDQPRFVGRQHRRLTPTIGLPTEDDPARNDRPQRADGAGQPDAIGGGGGRGGRTPSARMAEW